TNYSFKFNFSDRSFLPRCDKQWYFFSPCDRKYPNGSLTIKATEAGYWKATGKDHKIYSRSISTGVRKTLVFYKGRPPHGDKTEWLLHEYHLDENECKAGAGLQNAFVLCQVLKKDEPVAKTRGQRSTEIDKCDTSRKGIRPFYDNEEQSEDRSKQVKEIQTNSSLPYMTEDSDELNMWLDILLDEVSSSSSSRVPGKDTISIQVDAMPNDSGLQCESAWLPSFNDDFPEVPADLSFSRAEVANGYLFGDEMDDYFEESEILEEILHAASQDYDNSNVDFQVDVMPNDSGSQCESASLPSYNDDFPQVSSYLSFSQAEATNEYSFGEEMDDYLEEAEILNEILHVASQDSNKSNVDHSFPEDSYSDILNGDYLGLDDLENCDSSVSFDSSINNESSGIQMRPRSSAFQSYQQEVSSEGTYKRKIRLQLHKMEVSVQTNEKYVTARDSSCALSYLGESQIGSIYDLPVQQLLLDSRGEKRSNSEIIRQNESSATGGLPMELINQRDELSWCQKHGVTDPANFSSVSNSADIPVSHGLTSTHPNQFELLNKDLSETIETPSNTFETAVKPDTICVNKCQAPFQAILSSSSGNSPSVMSITKEIDNSEMSEHVCFEGYVLESNNLSTIELHQTGINTSSENPLALSTQAVCLCGNSTFEETMARSGASSLAFGSGKKSSAVNSSERKSPASPNEGPKHSKILSKLLGCIPASPASAMELPANLKSDKHILGLEDATNAGSVHFAVTSDPTVKKVTSKGIVEYSGLDMASSGLRLRVIQESNDIVSGGKGKSEEAYEHSTGTNLSSVHPRRLFSLVSHLGKRVSFTGSRGGVVLTCLFGTAFLFFFLLLSRVFWLFASTFSAIAF
ncbi:hypothetical protein KI387_019403, partial [Taxus chinensis]